ncbi:nuclear transport factor 2 family protein [Gloeobacter violaceus]|uniref:Gll0142 protein n=1 Tax=Gloeobacter violaceus (strain ATCC 29082 / PCC 7421) TaxID=251221 RepID=Q7NPB3_GLOVI|nr:nuclear transport factor 2 family protein [Gloeobacter violaceus]BAC88083.1 gll0142 [Gloeobacter violaceus PCC 7421]
MDECEAVLGANAAFYRAFEKRDIEAMAAVWSQGAASLCIHPGRPALRGWSAVRQSWEQIFKVTAYIEIETEILTCEVQGTLAYVVLMEKVLQAAGGQSASVQSMATNVFALLGGSWYLVHHHGSPIRR